MKKAFLQDWYPLGKGEMWFLGGLKHSPVAFGSYVSDNYFGYTNGEIHLRGEFCSDLILFAASVSV